MGKRKTKKKTNKVPNIDPPLGSELKYYSLAREQRCAALFDKYSNMEPSQQEIPIKDIVTHLDEDVLDEKKDVEVEIENVAEEENDGDESDDTFQISDDEEFLPHSVSPNKYTVNQFRDKVDQSLIDLIEKKLKSKIKYLFLAREINIVLDSDALKESDNAFRAEIKEIINKVGQEKLYAYLLALISWNKDDDVWNLIENVFKSRLKEFIMKRENASSQEDYEYFKVKVQKEWDELCTIMDDQDVLTYALSILRPFRNPWLDN